MKPNVENPARQGPIEFKSIPCEETGSRQLLKLTKNGHRFLTHTENAGKGPAVYHDFTKPREAHHDADLNRLCRKEAVKIEGHGGRNLRVVLDYELKKHLYRDLAKLGKDRNSVDGKHAVAERHGLHVVRGQIPAPGVRMNMKLAMENEGAWTSNLTPVTTASARWLKKSALDSLSTLTRKTLLAFAVSWIRGN